MRREIATGLLAAAAIAATGCGGEGRPDVRGVVLISIDTCRADRLGAYGDPGATTPSIDAVAREGVLFEQAQTTNPITLPAHASLLTGTIPPVHGVRNNESYRLAEDRLTLAEILRERGWRTAAFVGAFPLAARFGLAQGFETYDDAFLGRATRGTLFNERPAEEVSRAAIAWLGSRGAEPFFLFLHYFDPHGPYAPPEPWASSHRERPYDGEIAYADAWIGRVVEQLKALDRYDSTVLAIVSDHGESLGDHGERTHGYFVYGSTIRVPMILRLPGGPVGARVAEAVSLVDVVPTVLAAAGIEAPPDLDGIDLGPLLRGRSAGFAERDLYSESFLPASFGCSPLRGLVRDGSRYVWSVRPELYHLRRDPAEADDLSAREPQRVRELHDRLAALVGTPRAATGGEPAPALDAESRRRLAALGYVGGGAVRDEFALEEWMEDPKDFVASYVRIMDAESSYEAGRLDEAEAIGREILARRPKLLRVHAILGRVALARGRGAEAIASFERFLEIAAEQRDPSGQPRYPDLDHHVAVTHLNLGLAWGREGNGAKAREQLEQALLLGPDLVEAHVALGRLLQTQRDPDGARPHFERALALAPDDARAHYGLAVVLARGGDARAEEHYARAIASDPDHAEAHTNLGALLAGRGEVGRARGHFEQALRIDPGNALAHANLGNVLVGEGRLEEARAHYEQALRLRPDEPTARRGLAHVRARLGDGR